MARPRLDRSDARTEFIMPGQENKLDAPVRAGFVRRWVINKPGNIETYQSYGYKFAVEEFEPNIDSSERTSMDTRISRPAGGGFIYYLMEIPKSRNKEIEKYKREQNALVTKSIGIPNNPNVYAPKWNGREQIGVEEDVE